MFCQKCGNQQLDDEMFCGKCGTPFASNTYAPQRYDVEGEAKEIHIVHDVYTDKDRPSCLVNFLCFIFPLLGLVLYIWKHDTSPKCAKSYLEEAIAGVLAPFVLLAILWVIGQCSSN